MKVLSLFDGISCGRVALDRAGIPVSEYLASEIDKNAIRVSKSNWPDIKQVGDVTEIDPSDIGNIDLLIGGSPCQGFSRAGSGLNFDDPRSKLFFEFVRLKNELKPKFWLLENVKMRSDISDIISEILGVYPATIDSANFSAQRRVRKYWTNIPIMDYEDKGIECSDIIDVDDESENSPGFHRYFLPRMGFQVSKSYCTIMNDSKKAQTMLRRDRGAWKGNLVRVGKDKYRFASVKESCRLQTLPDDYCREISDNRACEALGNGWTVDVIAHIFKGMTEAGAAD